MLFSLKKLSVADKLPKTSIWLESLREEPKFPMSTLGVGFSLAKMLSSGSKLLRGISFLVVITDCTGSSYLIFPRACAALNFMLESTSSSIAVMVSFFMSMLLVLDWVVGGSADEITCFVVVIVEPGLFVPLRTLGMVNSNVFEEDDYFGCMVEEKTFSL